MLADKVQIQQVLVNLMRNAIEAMQGSDRRELTVSAAVKGGMVEVSIADTGPGISPDIAERLFQPFFTTKSQGMGVGLSISRTIVEAHGGQDLGPHRGQHRGGATFRFTLRAVKPEDLGDHD